MKIIEKLFPRIKRPIPNNPYLNIGGQVPPDRTQEGFLSAYGSIGWLHAVVFRIALGCSEVEWTLFDSTNQEKPKQIFKHPVLNLLHQVNPFQTSNEFIALDTIYNELIGESFWALNFNALGEPAEIILPYPHKMSVVPAQSFPFVKGYVYGSGAQAIPFDVNEIIHFKYPNPLNQYRGLGSAQAIGVELDSEQYSSQWVRQFFFNSARPDGVIQFDYNLSDEQFDKLKKQWSEKYKGVSKAHQVALLEGGGKYIQIQNTVKDMDFPNLKLKNRDSILGIVGMPLSVMGISENVNKANAEAGDYTFARWIVKPRLDWKKAKLQEQLIPKFRRSENITLGFKEVVPQTAEQKRLDAESGVRTGYWTVNEARIATGKDAIPSGDVLLIPLNLIPTDIKKPMNPPVSPTDETTSISETPKSKGLTPDQKKLHWENYALKTARQELVFKKVFDSVFNEQKNQVVEQLKTLKSIKSPTKLTPSEWEDEYANGTPHWATDMNPSLFAQEFVEELKKNKLSKLLEIGCGNGRDSIFFSKAKLNVTAIDVAPSAIELAQSNAGKAEVTNIRFMVANVEELPFEDKEFEAVFTLSVLHATNLKKSLPQIARVVKQGGLVFIYLYANTESVNGGIENHTTVDDFTTLLKDNGFEMLDFYTEQEEAFDEFGEKHNIIVTLLRR